MSDIISLKVPKELKEKMKRYRIDWSEEIRKFLEERVRVLELLETLDDIENKARKRRTRVDSVKLIRDARRST